MSYTYCRNIDLCNDWAWSLFLYNKKTPKVKKNVTSGNNEKGSKITFSIRDEKGVGFDGKIDLVRLVRCFQAQKGKKWEIRAFRTSVRLGPCCEQCALITGPKGVNPILSLYFKRLLIFHVFPPMFFHIREKCAKKSWFFPMHLVYFHFS